MFDDLIGRAISIEGRPWTILGKAEWGMYLYLGNPDKDEVIVRHMGLVKRALELGAGVDPNGTNS